MNQKFYMAFGCLTSAFAHMEADLRLLVAGLGFKGDVVIAAAFMDGSQLSENLAILRKLGRQYRDAPSVLKEILDRTEKIRQRRNLFIHGLWSPRNFGEEEGFATVTDIRTTYKEGKDSRREWTHGQSENFSISDFQSLLDEVTLISTKIEELCEWFEMHEEIEFGYLGSTVAGKPTVFAINSDGSLTPIEKK